MQFPVSGAKGNELTVINIGRFSGTGTTTANGAYTITGLNPEMLYIVVMKWLENGVSKTKIIPVETLSLQQYIDAQGHVAEEIDQYVNSGGVLHKEDQAGLSSTEVDGQGAEDPIER